jgi:FkbM family methyltransferase
VPPSGLKNTLSLLTKSVFGLLGMRLVRLSPDKVRGIESVLDLKFLLNATPSPLICDVGANDGETVNEFLTHFQTAKVIAFEPFLECFEILKTSFASNQNVRLKNVALGANPASARLRVFSGNRMNSLLDMAVTPDNVMYNRCDKIGTQEVVVDSLDHFCSVNHVDRIDALKVDTQGFDLNVLKGAVGLLAAHRIRSVLLEINFVPMYDGQPTFAEIHECLTSWGYRLIDFYNHTRQKGYIAWCDACYVAVDDTDAI